MLSMNINFPHVVSLFLLTKERNCSLSFNIISLSFFFFPSACLFATLSPFEHQFHLLLRTTST